MYFFSANKKTNVISKFSSRKMSNNNIISTTEKQISNIVATLKKNKYWK